MPPAKSRSVKARSSSWAFDAVPRLKVGHEPRVEAGQLPYPLPDLVQPRQHGPLVVVQIEIALVAEALHAIGAAQNLAFAGQLFVFSATERGGSAVRCS